jgi:hypothetical protein
MSSVLPFGMDMDLASPLVAWLGGSLLFYVVASNLLWRFSAWLASPPGSAVVQTGRLLYGLGVPYLALGGWPQRPYRGVLSPESLGIVGFGGQWDVAGWLEAAGTGIGLGVVAFLFLLLAWSSAQAKDARVGLYLGPRPWWALLVDIVYLQAHWAFYRAGFAQITGSVYWGVFLGLGFVLLEWSLNPLWRCGWHREAMAGARWVRTVIALIVALVFLYSRNLWVCLAVHLLLELPLRAIGRVTRGDLARGESWGE